MLLMCRKLGIHFLDMTHLPIAAAVLAAVAALAALFVSRREVAWLAAVMSMVALLAVLPTLVTGVAAGRGRINDEGKPYIQSGVIVSNIPQNTRIFRHQMLGITGTVVAFILAVLAVATLWGRSPNKYLVAALAVLLALLWGTGSHLGGKDLWGPDTFPAFHRTAEGGPASTTWESAGWPHLPCSCFPHLPPGNAPPQAESVAISGAYTEQPYSNPGCRHRRSCRHY